MPLNEIVVLEVIGYVNTIYCAVVTHVVDGLADITQLVLAVVPMVQVVGKSIVNEVPMFLLGT